MDNICQLTLKVYVCQCCHELIYFHNAAVDCFFLSVCEFPHPLERDFDQGGTPWKQGFDHLERN